jgi:hypothetical protein
MSLPANDKEKPISLDDLFALLASKAIAPGTAHYNDLWQAVRKWRESYADRLMELLDAEKSNYATAKAMPTPNREIDKGDLLSRSHGRITLIEGLLGPETLNRKQAEAIEKL